MRPTTPHLRCIANQFSLPLTWHLPAPAGGWGYETPFPRTRRHARRGPDCRTDRSPGLYADVVFDRPLDVPPTPTRCRPICSPPSPSACALKSSSAAATAEHRLAFA